MLKGIPEILSPELLKVLCEMGHSDRIVIADGNFPSESSRDNLNYLLAGDSRRLNGTGMGIRKMRYVQP